MSSQLQVTGEAKIRAIQGPVVANSGVITALDGAASQYVRGDGTLADFPTSTGGGSSVSYYLNSSVSQGTIGGVAYRELSKEPIIGAGTDIAISTTGYVASYITDANDPDVLSIPGGNFNCEFYFSVNNNTGNPYTYAELYKYDGSTFTLLGSNVGVPEYINQGTIIAPYYFAIPVATSALALTDRLAIRIYVNVSGRTITLHTENSHLCQVVTTLSKGMVSLNNLTDQSQNLTTGTSGTNFAIVSSGDTHTFNLPIASATNTGKLSSSDWSVFNAKQAALSFTAPLVNTSNTISIPVATSLVDGYLDNLDWVKFNTAYNDSIVSAAVTGTTTKTLTLTQQDAGTITASWTDDNTDAVSSVFGRTGAVVAVSGDYNTSQVTENTNLYFTDARSRAALSFTAGSGAYNSTTGVITIPTNTNQLTNGASFITLASLSGGVGISYNNTTGVITNSAPDQTVSLTAGAGISISGTYPSFTIASTITQYTDALARAALSFVAGSGAYNSTTGVITIPTNTSQLTNGANYITLTSLSGSTGISYNNTTGAISSTITQYTDALARAAISLTTTGTSGAATYNSTTGVLNIPQYIGGVTSVFGRTGAVVATEGDYSLTQLSDVTITTPSTGQVLKYNGTAWVNDTDANTGTVTSVGLSSVTSGVTIGSSPITTSGTITIAIDTASGSQNGLLSSTDWTTFNNKGSGTVTSVAALTLGTTGTDLSSSVATGTTTPVITLNVPTASATNRGALSSADWTTFNNKANALSGTINTIAYWDSASTIASLALATYPSLTELSYVKGVTSAIQTQLNAKQGTLTLTTTGTSGAATLIGDTLNIPQYSGGGGGGMAIGGSITSATAGSVLFAGAAGVLAQDNANFFWDDTNNRLGIGTSTPTCPLDVIASNTTAINLRLRGRASDSVGQMEFWNNAQTTRYGYFATDSTGMFLLSTQAIPLIFGSNTTEVMRLTSGGSVTIGNISATGSKFQVNGSAAIGYSASTAAPTNGLAVSGNVTFGTNAVANTTSDLLTINKNQNAATRLIVSNSTSGTSSVAEINLTSSSGAGSFNIGKYSASTNAYKNLASNTAYLYNGTAGDIAFLNDFASGGFNISVGGSSTAQFILNSSGNLGLSTSTIGSKLQVNGNAAIGYSASTAAPTNGLIVAGDVNVSASGSSTASPRVMGISSLGGGNAGRIQFGDLFNCWQTSNGGLMQIASYHGMQIYGARVANGATFTTAAGTDPSLNVIGTEVGRPTLVVTACGSQTANIQQWRNSSSTALSVVTSGGRILVNTTTDNGQGPLQVNGGITALNVSLTGEILSATTTFNGTYYHIISGGTSAAQTFTLPSPTSNNYQYVVVNKSNFPQTISAGSGFTIYDMTGTDSATITLASKARCFIIADGSGFYQIF